jgi:hypothetical protein
MEKEDQLGYGFPIVCPRHPSAKQMISAPGQIRQHAPEGGCLRPCEYGLPCGHVCPSMVHMLFPIYVIRLLIWAFQCHTDQDNHRRMKCDHPCNRTPCPREHPCKLLCSDPCGDCMFPLYGVKLPCGHIAKSVPWQVPSEFALLGPV